MYRQITADERYTLACLRWLGHSDGTIARILGRHRSTIWRERRRNAARFDGHYRAQLAQWYAMSRRSHSRRNRRFGAAAWRLVRQCLERQWSPEQIAGRLRRDGRLRISHETIYRYVWADKRAGGTLHRQLRQVTKRFRKRYGYYDRRGRVGGKRPIGSRPAVVASRRRIGDWEIDTMLGAGQAGACVLSLVERKTGYVVLGHLRQRTTAALNARAIELIRAQRQPVLTITADNGTEFHSYSGIERATTARFYFATPHHAWERGTSENTNGLLRQYLPKAHSMAHLTQSDCAVIARKLNQRPRKRLDYQTPEECYER